MRSSEIVLGRSFVLAFDHGDDFFEALIEFCESRSLRQGFIPSFIAGFSEVDLVGTCEKLQNPMAPVWSKVQLSNVEVFGGGTLAFNDRDGVVSPHIHVSVGLKERSATAHTSHLLSATVQFLTEMLVVEVASPTMTRVPDPSLFDVPLLRLENETQARE